MKLLLLLFVTQKLVMLEFKLILLDDNTMKLVKDYYVQKVYHDVVVREINPDFQFFYMIRVIHKRTFSMGVYN